MIATFNKVNLICVRIIDSIMTSGKVLVYFSPKYLHEI